MKSIIRNLIRAISHFKMATLLNVLGLSVAFAAFMVIMMQLDYDRNFDRCHPHADCIFRLDIEDEGNVQAVICRPMADLFIASSPHVLKGALIEGFNRKETQFAVERDGRRYYFKDKYALAYGTYADVFEFDMVDGAADLSDMSKALIPQSVAERMFPSESAVGKMIIFQETGETVTVSGVYKDFPSNSLVRNVLYQSIPEKENLNNWNNWNYEVYVRLDSPDAAQDIIDNFKKSIDVKKFFGEDFSWEDGGLRLTSVPDLHFTTNVLYDDTPKASRSTLVVLFAIAIVILVIAGINFTNFSTALSPMRVKGINTQKVFGASNAMLRVALVCEAVATCAVAFLLALGLVDVFSKTPLAALVDAEISLAHHAPLMAVVALIAVCIGVLAGLYPAFYMTSFQPALVLKGSFGLSPKGRKLRNLLISVQFVASFALIIGAMFMYLQNYFMQHTALGYDKDQMIVTNITRKINEKIAAFANELKAFAGVEDVTFAEQLLSSQDVYMGWGRSFKGEQIMFQCLPVNWNFLDVVGVEIKEGRSFRESDMKTKYGVYVFNERAKSDYNMQLGDMVDSIEIVGFMPDVKFASFRTEVVPMAFFLWGTHNWGRRPGFAYVKVKAGSDMRAAMEHVKSTLAKFDGDYQFDVRFYDEVLNNLYEKETRLSDLITLFSLIAVFISIVGVFGLVVFDSEYRRKEIGIRKVFGSTTGEILALFNKTYMKIVAACFVIAAPIAYYAVAKWLENFAYKTPLRWWVFALSFVIVAAVTAATVTFQNWRAANANPVDSIKSE